MVKLSACNSVSSTKGTKLWDAPEMARVDTAVSIKYIGRLNKQFFTLKITIESVPLGISQRLVGASSLANTISTCGRF